MRKTVAAGIGFGVGFCLGVGAFKLENSVPTVAVIRLAGQISEGPSFGAPRINFQSFSKLIDRSFRFKNLKAVCLRINSPGGSPVQSELIAKRIQALSKSRNVPVYAFVEDMAASGGYFLACGAQEIYASESSLVGSIGVINQSFGLQEIAKRYDLEIRLQTAGENKAIDNPFIEKSEAAKARTQRFLVAMHEHFISFVKDSRGDRLKGEEGSLFSGDVWTGKKALELGLIDGLETDVDAFVQREFGEGVRIVSWKSGNWLSQFAYGALVSEVMDQLEERMNDFLMAKFR